MVNTATGRGDTPLGKVDAGLQRPGLPVRATPTLVAGQRPVKVTGLLVVGVGGEMAPVALALDANGRGRHTGPPARGDGPHAGTVVGCLAPTLPPTARVRPPAVV